MAAFVIIIAVVAFLIYHHRRSKNSSDESIDMDVEAEIITPVTGLSEIASVSLFSTNIEESDPFDQDFEEKLGYSFDVF